MSDWLDALKPGDRVAVSSNYGRRLSVGTVERRDKVKIIVSGMRFSAKNGNAFGPGSWDRASLVGVSQELLARAQAQQRRRVALAKIERAQLDKLPLEVIEQAAAILSSVTPPEARSE